MFFTFENIMFTLLTLVCLFLLNRVVLVPRREAREWLRLRSIIERHYPLKLMKVLSQYRDKDGKVALSEETKAILNKLLESSTISDVIRAIETGRIEVYIPGPQGPDFKETSQRLYATFVDGEIVDPCLAPAYGSGKTGL